MTTETLRARVAGKRQLTDEIFTFTLVDAAGGCLPPADPGAHVDVHVGDGLIRQYSLFNGPEDEGRYCIGVQREAGGRGGSMALCDGVEEGDEITISDPRNHFGLEAGAPRYLLLAGGIGVTPILGMARNLLARGADFEFHYSVRSHNHAAFLPLIGTLGLPPESFFLHLDDGPENQRLDLPALRRSWTPGALAYVCGPVGYMEAVREGLAPDWPGEAIRQEFFSPADPVTAADKEEDGAFFVKLAHSGDVVEVPAGESAASALIAHGVTVSVSCEQGVCGSCLVNVLEGALVHRDSVLTDQERDSGKIWAPCISRAPAGETIVIDL